MQALDQGYVLQAGGEFHRALASFQEARGLFHECGERVGEATCLHCSGAACLKLNRPSDALDYLLAALDIHRESSAIQFQAPVTADVGAVYREMGRFGEAEKRYDEAMRLYELTGNDSEVRRCQAKIAEIAALRGSQ